MKLNDSLYKLFMNVSLQFVFNERGFVGNRSTL